MNTIIYTIALSIVAVVVEARPLQYTIDTKLDHITGGANSTYF